MSGSGLIGVVRALPHLCAFTFTIVVINTFHNEPFFNTLQSMVMCPLPLPDTNASGHGKRRICPKGSLYNGSGLDTCEAVPPDDPDWSYSRHCIDQAFTAEKATVLSSESHASSLVIVIPVLLCSGPFMDSYGRRPVSLFGMSAFVAFGIVMIQFTLLPPSAWSQKAISLMFFGKCICAFAATLMPSIQTMLADLTLDSAHDPRVAPIKYRRSESVQSIRARGDAYAAMGAMVALGRLAASLVNYWALTLQLTSWTWVWVGYATVAGLFLAFFAYVLPETFANKTSRRPSASACMADMRAVLATICGDGFMRIYYVVFAFLGSVMVTFDGMVAVFFVTSMEFHASAWAFVASIAGVPPTILVAAAATARCIRSCGVERTFGVGIAASVVGLASGALAALWFEAAAWPASVLAVAGMLLHVFGQTAMNTCNLTLISSRFAASCVGSALVMSEAACIAAALPTILVYKSWLVRPSASGWEAARIWLGTLFMVAGAGAIILALFKKATPTVSEEGDDSETSGTDTAASDPLE